MANSDVTVTLAGKFGPVSTDAHTMTALRCLFRWMNAHGQFTAPTQAQFAADIRTAVNLLPKPFSIPLQVQRASIVIGSAIAIQNTGLATNSTTLNQWISAASYLLQIDGETLNALDIYLEGVSLGALT